MSSRKVSHLSDLSSLQSKLRGKKVVDKPAVLASICHEMFYGLLRIRDGVFAPCSKEERRDAHRGAVQGIAANRPFPMWSHFGWVEFRAAWGSTVALASRESRHEQTQTGAWSLRTSDFKAPGDMGHLETPVSRLESRWETGVPPLASEQ